MAELHLEGQPWNWPMKLPAPGHRPDWGGASTPLSNGHVVSDLLQNTDEMAPIGTRQKPRQLGLVFFLFFPFPRLLSDFLVVNG